MVAPPGFEPLTPVEAKSLENADFVDGWLIEYEQEEEGSDAEGKARTGELTTHRQPSRREISRAAI